MSTPAAAPPHGAENAELRQRRNRPEDEIYPANGDNSDQASIMTTDKDSPGVRRIEAMTSMWTLKHRVVFLGTLIVMVYGRR